MGGREEKAVAVNMFMELSRSLPEWPVVCLYQNEGDIISPYTGL